MPTQCLMVFCTVPNAEKGGEIAEILVSERLCACVNLMNDLKSFYWWSGKVQKDPEALMILKTTTDKYEALEQRILALHPYRVPEVLALPVVQGSGAYLDWVRAETELNA